jgi:DNA modification methylase
VNRLFYGDNLDVLRGHVASESVDLVYLDPPFNSNRNYNVLFGKHERAGNGDTAQIQAFSDTWTWTPATDDQYAEAVSGGLPSRAADALSAFRTLLGDGDAMAYLVNMTPRLVDLHRVLKPTGSLYLHCDPTMSHYLKILLDAVFGPERFRNEVVWHYNTGGNAKSHWAKKHDVILYFTKSDTFTFNTQREPIRGAAMKDFRRTDADGRKYLIRKVNGKDYTYYADQGRICSSVWEITMSTTSPERLGYPTQKPVALLERIISASSNPGDVVLDPFCGCGTTIDAAQRLDRQWTGIDITYIAIDLIEKRLLHTFGPSITGTYTVHGTPRDLAGARALFQHSPFDFERWAVAQINAEPNEKQVGDKGIDGVARFWLDKKTRGRVLVSVKGGKTVGPQVVRDLIGTVQTQKAQMGVLLLMGDPTPGVVDAVNHGGTYTWPVNGAVFPQFQVLTVQDLLAGTRPTTPPLDLPYIQAARAAPAARTTDSLFGT